jgi:pyruvate,water dikinase
MFTAPLNNVLDPDQYGSKAAQLARMRRAGFPVPDGFAVSTRAFSAIHLADAGIEPLINEIRIELARIGAPKYMVRSSAIGEDADDSSFAGQLDSFASSADTGEVVTQLRRCWASYDKENVRAYEEHTGRKLNGMGVVIQELIEPDFAGVIFTRSHLRAGQSLVEYVEGHSEKLVSGEVTPKSFHFSRTDAVREKDFLPELERGLAISAEIEQLYGAPLDIEWALKDGEFHVVQARPITAGIKAKSIYWSNTNLNENYPEQISPLLYSIARDSYYHYFKNLSKLFRVPASDVRRLEPEYANVVGIFGCKMYYNMSSIHAILSASPFAGLLISSFDNFVGYDAGTETPKRDASFRQKLSFIREFFSLGRRLNKNAVEFESFADAYSKRSKCAVTIEDLRALFHEFIEIRMHSWYRASLADFFAMTFHGLLGKFCATHYGAGAPGIQNRLIQGIPGLVSGRPIIEMHRVINEIRRHPEAHEKFRTLDAGEFLNWIKNDATSGTIRDSIESYLEKWGFRCSGELMLTSQNYIERPVSFVALLQQYERMPDDDPERIIHEKNLEATKAERAFMQKIRGKHRIPSALLQNGLLRFLVKRATGAIAYRERVRLKQALVYFRFKQVLLRIEKEFIKSGLLNREGDVFFLTYHEISEHLSASSMLPELTHRMIEARRDEHVRASELFYPDDFFNSCGAYTGPGDVVPKVQSAEGKGLLSGMCACGGSVEGTAKVLTTVLEAGKLEKGDILVTRQTDPGWVVVFPLISGLIVERGGMLSHGAIVSREFGIPAIVGVDSATAKIKDGDRLILNADTGKITICG